MSAATAIAAPGHPRATPEFEALLAMRAVTVAFQPVVELATRRVVGLEALSRGPAGSAYESPAALFGEARRCGRTAELDWVCRAAAFGAVLDAGLPSSLSLFVNTEPESLGAPCPGDLVPVVARAESLLRVFVEVNDRALLADPAGLLAAVDRGREMGWGIAVDDVGSSRTPLAMLPVLHADLVKLDLGLLVERSQVDAAAVVLATLRHVEQTGTALCVERIETDDQLRWALALGARYGQGRLLGEPGPLAEDYVPPEAPVPLVADASADVPGPSPLGLLAEAPLRRVDAMQFRQLQRAMAFGSLAPGAAPVVLVGLGSEPYDADVAATFPQEGTPLLMVVFGSAVDAEPAPGVRGVRVASSDPLAEEPFLVAMSEKGPFAVLGKAVGPDAVDVLATQEPEVVHAIARHLVRRIPAPGTGDVALAPWTAVPADDALPGPHADGTGAPDGGGRTGRFGFGRRR